MNAGVHHRGQGAGGQRWLPSPRPAGIGEAPPIIQALGNKLSPHRAQGETLCPPPYKNRSWEVTRLLRLPRASQIWNQRPLTSLPQKRGSDVAHAVTISSGPCLDVDLQTHPPPPNHHPSHPLSKTPNKSKAEALSSAQIF